MPGIDSKQPLTGYTVWVTRPQHQSQPLIAALTALGAQTLAQPLLAIEPASEPESQATLANAAGYNLIIFVSANAVEFSAAHHPAIANNQELAAIGSSTAAKCREYGLKVKYVPEQADSEALLALPRFNILAGQRVLIVRGFGGRTYLGEQLQARGAQVDYAQVYRRSLPAIRLVETEARADVILITSSEALLNLVELAQRDQQAWVFNKQLLVIHPRIAGRVSELGFTLKPLVAKQANDHGMIETLVDWAQFGRSEQASE